MLNYLLLWEGVRSLHLLSDPNAVCCCCLKRSLLSIFLLEVRKTIFQSTLPAFLGILLNLRRRLRIWWSGETSLDLEKNKPRGGKGGGLCWKPLWEAEDLLGMPALLCSSSYSALPGRRQLPAPARLH